ncbi:UNVERIFIED_CONTAM: hypothetical protein GTU68_022226 [Idotea baltica]|nr:hypothetical protein [Idotea baltica]
MEKTEFIWHNGKLIKWAEAQIHVLSHSLHYGTGAFEGIRVYKTDRGPAIFRLKDHLERLAYSASALDMKIPWNISEIEKETLELLKANKLEQGYIRHIVYFGEGILRVKPMGNPVQLSIACWPWGAYLPHDMVDLKISKYIRIHPQSTTADAKICGHYVNSVHAAIEIQDTKYHEALLLDFEGKVAEGPGENLFIVKDGKLITPKLGRILSGITRMTIFELAKDNNLEVVETELLPEDVFNADEAFYTGTAAEVTPIKSLDDNIIADGKIGKITELIKTEYMNLVTGKNTKYDNYLTFVK